MAGVLRRGSSLARILQRSSASTKNVARISCTRFKTVTEQTGDVASLSSKSYGTFTENPAAHELYNRHRSQMPLNHKVPDVAVDAWVAPNATLIGDVVIEDRATVWYGSVLRGDLNQIRLGAYSNLGEKCVIHAAKSSPVELSAETFIGKYVTVGPQCSLRSCLVEDEVVIGERCVLMEGSLVERGAILEAGSVVPPGRRIPGGQVWAGTPAKFVRLLTSDEIAEIKPLAEAIHKNADEHAGEFLPYGTAYLELEKLRMSLSALTSVKATEDTPASASEGKAPEEVSKASTSA